MGDVIVLSDSLFSGRKGWGVHLQRIWDRRDSFNTCLCVASGCSLMKWWDAKKCPDSAVSMAARALGENPLLKRRLKGNPTVRIVVLNARGSIAVCRESEEFPRTVRARKSIPVINKLQTPWTVCDLEDVVQQRPNRKRFAELEECALRDRLGFYNDWDTYHLRASIAKEGQDELIKAVRRTALKKYGDGLRNEVLLVIAAGWNMEEEKYNSLDQTGKAWLRAELVAAAELCALDGHPLSTVRSKLAELTRRRHGNHRSFFRQSIRSIRAVPLRRRWSNDMTRCRSKFRSDGKQRQQRMAKY